MRNDLQTQLIGTGFCADVTGDGEEGLFAGLNYPLDAATVDIGLPDCSGLEVIRRWRMENRSFPVVVLTARCGWHSRVDGIQAGADDYIEKPFRFEELVVRVRCVMRRAHGWSSPLIICGPYELDTESLTASAGGQRPAAGPNELRAPPTSSFNAECRQGALRNRACRTHL
jgi:two-component system response regulator PhoP